MSISAGDPPQRPLIVISVYKSSLADHLLIRTITHWQQNWEYRIYFRIAILQDLFFKGLSIR